MGTLTGCIAEVQKAYTGVAEAEAVVDEVLELAQSMGFDGQAATELLLGKARTELAANQEPVKEQPVVAPEVSAPPPPATPEPIKEAPAGLRQVTTTYLNGVEVPVFAPIGRLQRVRHKDDGYTGVIDSFFGNSLQLPDRAIVQWEGLGATNKVLWSEIEPAPPRFKVGDEVAWLDDDFGTRKPAVWTRIVEVSGETGRTVYRIIDSRFSGDSVQAFAFDGELEPLTSHPEVTKPKAETPRGKKELERKRDSAASTLDTLVRQARAAGAEKLANRMYAVGIKRTDGSSGFAPADVKVLADRIDSLIERAKANPADPFFDVQPGGKPKVPKLTKDEIEWRDRMARLQVYYSPGNVVKSYYGHDRVVEFLPAANSSSSWSVRVQAVRNVEGRWVPETENGREAKPRLHATMPDARDLAAGPVERAPPADLLAQPGEDPELAKAKQDMLDALGDLGDILSKGTRKNILSPEQEQRLLPVLVRLFDAAFRIGKLKFADAARFVLDRISAALGQDVADQITLENLQGAYVGMSGRYRDQGAEGMMAVAAVQSKDQLKETSDAADRPGGVEPGGADGQPGVAPPVRDDAGGDGASAPGGRGGASGARNRPGRGPRVPRPGPAAAGAQGDLPLPDEEPSNDGLDPTAGDGERGADDGGDGVPAESLSDEDVEEFARREAASDLDRRRAQREAESIGVIENDADNIRATLPMLLEKQQDDVIFAERRLTLEDGYGVLFTNGTGTGKTFTGLGVIKRFVKQGRTNILVLAPNDAVIEAWVRSGPALGLNITRLRDTQDAGTGVSVTTYANLRENNALVKRRWDLLVGDESQNLSSNADGEITSTGLAFQALTLHPDGAYQRTRMKFPELAREMDELQAEEAAAVKAKDVPRINAAAQKLAPLIKRFNAEQEIVRVEIADAQGRTRPRALFLSATPFSYEKSVRFYNGYLYDWSKDYVERGGYNQPSPYGAFMVRHFGYRMRYGKLTEPAKEVNRGLMQRAFNAWLKREAVLSGRMLDSDFDYDRRFVVANSQIGMRIDEAFAWFSEQDEAALAERLVMPDDSDEVIKIGPAAKVAGALRRVRAALAKKFDYHSRIRLLEALKAEAAVDYIQGHLDLGRKVVVFHDRIQGQTFDPFNLQFDGEENPVEDQVYEIWRREFTDLADYNWNLLKRPIEVMTEAFGNQTAVMNGTVPKKRRQQILDRFNDDNADPMVMVVQSDMDAGWSGHDTSGKYPRVVINFGLPVRPAKSIQQEGRIYRVGQASNAMFRYFNTRTNWERTAFAQTIAQRASAVENMAMGEEARGLMDSYIEAFEDTNDWPPGFEGEGTGGKERDRQAAQLLSEWDRAKSLYWSQLAKTSRTKAQEGTDYFATPEPIGLKMVEWGDARLGETMAEPSAGHGAIARWFPEDMNSWAVEKFDELSSRLALAYFGKIHRGPFENVHAVNKADVMAMNPPYGVGGKLAYEHLTKAYNDHLQLGGRIVALMPTGPAADARMEKFLNGTHEDIRPSREVFQAAGVGVHYGDTLTWNVFGREGQDTTGEFVRYHDDGRVTALRNGIESTFWANQIVGVKAGPRKARPEPLGRTDRVGEFFAGDTVELDGRDGRYRIEGRNDLGLLMMRRVDGNGGIPEGYRSHYIARIVTPGPRVAIVPNAPGAHVVATVKLPRVTFKRAGTEQPTHILVIDKLDKDQQGPARIDIDLSGLETIEELFEELENLTLPQRTKPRPVEVEGDDSPAAEAPTKPTKPTKPAKADKAAEGEAYAVQMGLEAITYTTNAGKPLRGVIIKHVAAGDIKYALPATGTFQLTRLGGAFVRIEHLKTVLDRFPLPPVAREERAVYAVREPDANYDLFGQPVSTDPRGNPPRRRAPRGNVPAANALSVRADPFFPGVYHATSQLVEVSRRELPVARVRSWSDAAAALSSLTRWAVEHFDVLVTDASGRPLALVGTFKGAPTQTSVYPGVVLMEALRIEGAAMAWGVHNHPSGRTDLSDADRYLSGVLTQSFKPSAVRWMGLAAVSKDAAGTVRFNAISDTGADISGMAIPGLTSAVVPIVERTIMDLGTGPGSGVGSPDNARGIVKLLASASNRPRVLLLNSQNMLTGHIDMEPEVAGALAGNGNFDRLINSAAEAGALAAIIANPGGALSSRQLDNLASALALADVRVLDVIDPNNGSSAVAMGQGPSIRTPVLSVGGTATPVPAQSLRNAVAEAIVGWSRDPAGPRPFVVGTATELPADVQTYLRQRRALLSTRGLMMPDGRVFLIADQIGSVEDGIKVLFHEVYGHFGLRAFLGDSYMVQMTALRVANPKLAAEADAWHKENGADEIRVRVERGMSQADAEARVRALAIEEALADRAGDAAPPKAWQVVMGRLQRALREMGRFGVVVADWLESMSEAETYWLLAQAREVVGKQGHANRVQLGDAATSRNDRRVVGDVPQEISSAATSRRQVPAALSKIEWEPGTTNADIGAGRFSDATEFLAGMGVVNLEFDPFNRSTSENVDAVSELASTRADTATVLNVLNVIKEAESRANVIRRAAKAIRDDGVAYFQTYEGDGSGKPAASRDGWQENRKTESYVAEIRKHFGEVVRRGQIIEARRPIRTPGDTWVAANGDVLFSRSPQGLQTYTPEFKRWFGNSKVVDAEGKPLVVYHGTYSDNIEVFDRMFMREKYGREALDQVGTWFSSKADDDGAGMYVGEGGSIMPAYLSIKNPWTVRFQGLWNKAQDLSGQPRDQRPNAKSVAALDKWMDENGIDGIRIKYDGRSDDEFAKQDVWVARRPEQIKSAIGNRGTFDPADPSILLSRTPQGNRMEIELRPISAAMPTSAMQTPFSAFDLANTVLETPIRVAATPLHLAKRMLAPGVTDAARKLDATFTQSLPGYEYVKAGVVDRYGLSDEYGEQKLLMRTAIRVNWRKTKEVVDKLRALSFEESRIAYLWMSDKTEAAAAARALMSQLPEDSQALLRSVKQDIHHLGKEAVRLGLVSTESWERNENFYLHRSYKRFLDEQAEMSHMQSQSARLMGDVAKRRGMRYDATMAEIAHTDWWERKTNKNLHDPSLKGQKFRRFELRASVPDTDTPQLFEDENGQQLGRLREVVYWPADEPVPARFGDWRDDGLWEARFFDKSQKVGMFRDFTLAERTKMGEVQEVRFAVATTLTLMTRDIETAKFLDWVARNESVAAPEAGGRPLIPEGHTVIDGASRMLLRSFKTTEWVRVPDDFIKDSGIRRFGRLAGRYVPGPVWNDLRQIAEFNDPASLVALWDWTMRAWKIAKTALSPVTHFNNTMGNLMFADMADVQGRHLHTALAAMLTQGKDPAMKRLIEDFEDNGGDAGMFNQAELRNELLEPLLEELRKQVQAESGQALVTASSILSLLTNKKYREAMVALRDSKGGKAALWTPRKMIELYGLEDQVFRLAGFVKAREDGLSNAEAGKFARESFLNYEINAPWINALRRTVLPFVAFVYRGAPLLAKTFASKPEKLAKYALIAGGFNALAYMMLGLDGDDEDRERAWLQEERSGYIWGFLTPRLIRMPWDDRNGEPVFLDVRRWVPMGDVVDTGQAQSAIPLPPPVLPGGPGVLLAEFFGNKSWFTGRNITLETDTLAQKADKSFDHLWKGMMPNFPGLPGTYSTDMLVDTFYGRAHPGPFGEERTSWGQAIPSVLGVKVASYPTEVMRTQRAFEWRQARQEAAREQRSTINRIRRMRNMDPEQVQAEIDAANAVAAEKFARIKEAEDRARRLAGEIQ
jgi:hypothetical protein